MALALSEVLNLHRAAGVPSPGGRVDGVVECLVRDARTRKVVQHVRQKNLATDALRAYWFVNTFGLAIWISEIGAPTWHVFRSGERVFMSGTVIQGSTRTITPSTMTWLMQTTFTPPAATRTINSVGLGYDVRTHANSKYLHALMTASILGTPVVQTSVQTLEINYRLLFQRT